SPVRATPARDAAAEASAFGFRFGRPASRAAGKPHERRVRLERRWAAGPDETDQLANGADTRISPLDEPVPRIERRNELRLVGAKRETRADEPRRGPAPTDEVQMLGELPIAAL